MRHDTDRVQSMGTQVSEDSKKSVRDMLLQMQTSHQLVRDMAMQLHNTGAEETTTGQEEPGTIRCRGHEDRSIIQQAEEGKSQRAGDQERPGKKKIGKTAGGHHLSIV